MKKKKDVTKQIANLIKECDTDDRGNLFREIGSKLIVDSQGYTGSLFIKMAVECGINNNLELKDV